MEYPEGSKEGQKVTKAAKKSLTHRTIDGLLWAGIGASANVVMQLCVVAVLARILLPRDFGMVAAAGTIVGLSTIFVNLGVAPAIVQRRDLTEAHINVGMTLSMMLGIAMGLVIALTAPLLADLYGMPQLTNLLRALSLVFPITSFSLVASALLQRRMMFRQAAIRNIISYLFAYGGVSISLALLGYGVWSMVIGQIVQTALQTVQTINLARQRVRFGWDRVARRDLLSYGFGSTLARIGNYIANQADYAVVGRMLGPSDLGLYGRAYQFISMPSSFFGTVMDKVLFPAMSKVQHDQPKLARAYKQCLASIAMVTLPLTGLLFISAPEIVAVLLGDRWTSVVEPFRILILSLLFRTSYKMSDSLARASAATLNRAWRQWIYAAAVIGGAMIGTHWGISGVAAGVSIAIAINFFLMLDLSIKISGVSAIALLTLHLRHLLVAGLTTGVGLLVLFFMRRAEFHEALRLSASALAAGLTWLLLARFWTRLLGEELEWVKMTIKSRLGRTS